MVPLLLLDDGLCVFDIVRRGTGPPERSSGSEIARAAWRLMLQCVRDGGGQGGIVSGIGTHIEPCKLLQSSSHQ